MTKHISPLLSAYALPFVALLNSPHLYAAELTPIETTVTVDAAQTLRTMDPQRLGGTNVAVWYSSATYFAPDVQKLVADLHPRYIRIPGGSYCNALYWNGHGVRGADGKVDPTKVGPDG